MGGRRGEREELGCLDIGEIWGGEWGASKFGGNRSCWGIGNVGGKWNSGGYWGEWKRWGGLKLGGVEMLGGLKFGEVETWGKIGGN